MSDLGFWEEYKCGCISQPKHLKRDLLGYCAIHGADRINLYKGMVPMDDATRDRVQKILDSLEEKP